MPRDRRVRLTGLGVIAAGICTAAVPLALLPAAASAQPAGRPGPARLAAPGLSPQACRPQVRDTGCLRYSYTGTDQRFTVPDGVRSINVHEWGAGGGASPGSAVTSALRIGGGSGYASGAGVSDGAAVAGLTATSVAPGQGTPPAAARRNPFYLAGLSWGGGDASSGNGFGSGANGQVVIQWTAASAPPAPAPTPTRHPRPTPTPSSSPRPSPTSSRPSGPGLPVTGFPFAGTGIAGMALILLGAIAVAVGRPPRELRPRREL